MTPFPLGCPRACLFTAPLLLSACVRPNSTGYLWQIIPQPYRNGKVHGHYSPQILNSPRPCLFTALTRGAIIADTMKLYWWNGTAWTTHGITILSHSGDTIAVITTHTGLFALLGVPKPENPYLRLILRHLLPKSRQIRRDWGMRGFLFGFLSQNPPIPANWARLRQQPEQS